MREIKFRAWDKSNHREYSNPNPPKRMTYYGRPVVLDDGFIQMDCIGQCAIGDSPIGERHIIMQFTGLKDKKGREIYEGDILKTDSGNYVLKEALPFLLLERGKNEPYDNGDYYQGGDIMAHNWKSFEVLGNIYENPELLIK